MRILTLEVTNIRGIKNINLSPNGQNVVVYGPNGTGKSAIVDAIDFLLTGKISRLTGEGSKVLDLKEHGCHIDSRDDLKKTVVKAKVKIGDQEAVLQRTLSKPSPPLHRDKYGRPAPRHRASGRSTRRQRHWHPRPQATGVPQKPA